MKYLVSIFLFVTAGFTALRAELPMIEIRDISSWEKAILLAENRKSLIYVFVGAGDCSSCKAMRRGALSDEGVEELIGRDYLPVYISTDNAFGKTFAAGFGVANIPASVWMTGSEFVWRIEEGILTAGELITATRQVEEMSRIYPEILDSALNRRTLPVQQWLSLFEIARYNRLDFYPTLLENFNHLLDWDSLRSTNYHPYVREYVVELTDPIFQYIRIAPDTVLGPDFPLDDYYAALYSYHLSNAIAKKDSSMVETIELQLLPIAPTDSSDPQNVLPLRELALWQEYFASTGQIAYYRNITGATLEEIDAGGDIIVSEIQSLFNIDLRNASIAAAREWVENGIAVEETAGLYIVLADIHLVSRKDEEAANALIKASALNPTAEEQNKIRYLEYVLESRY